MDRDDEKHLFDLIVNPAIGVLTTIVVPIAFFLSVVSILQGHFLFVIPLLILLILAIVDLMLFAFRFIAANAGKHKKTSYHRYAFYLLLLTSLLSVIIIFSAFYLGTINWNT